MNILEIISLFYCVFFNFIANFDRFRMKMASSSASHTYAYTIVANKTVILCRSYQNNFVFRHKQLSITLIDQYLYYGQINKKKSE